MKSTLFIGLTLVVVFSLIFAISPTVYANYDSSNTYTRHWAIPIGNATGTLQIKDDSNIEELKSQAISSDEASSGYDNVVKTHLGQAVNDSGDYFLVWKVVTSQTNNDASATYTMNILDAGNGQLLTSVDKDGGGCDHKYKSGTT